MYMYIFIYINHGTHETHDEMCMYIYVCTYIHVDSSEFFLVVCIYIVHQYARKHTHMHISED